MTRAGIVFGSVRPVHCGVGAGGLARTHKLKNGCYNTPLLHSLTISRSLQLTGLHIVV